MATKVKTGVLGTLTELNFADNGKARFGAGNDLQIYHDGNHSRIVESGSGDMIIQGDEFSLMNTAGTEYMIFADNDSFVKLYYNGSNKLETTSTGIDVTGTITGDGLTIEPTTATGLTYGADGTNSFINFEANSVAASVQLYAGQSSGGYLAIGTKSSGGTLAERMRIDSSGSVGIACTDGTNLLTVDANSASTTTDSISVRNRGVSSANHTAGLRFQFNSAVPSAIRSRLTNTSNGAGTLSFFTSSDGSAANLSERMTLTSTGAFFLNNIIGFGGANSDVRYDTSSGQIYYQTSSQRYKSEITNLEDSLNKIQSLRPVRFKDNHTEKFTTGLIAEEVVDIIPEVVFKKDIDGFDTPQPEGINYSDITPFLIKAIQELKAEIEELKESK